MTTNSLTKETIRKFHIDGFTPTIRVLSAESAIQYRHKLQAVETVVGKLRGEKRLKCHLLYKWVSDLIKLPSIVGPVKELLGPNILCWGTDMWVKEPNSNQFVSWHQDSRYWGIQGNDLMTAWIALSPATVESGCMRMLPGSHRSNEFFHEDTFHDHNMLTRGQTIFKGIDETKAVNIEVDTGEAVYFTYRIAHASHPNHGKDRRIGIAIRYISPAARQVKSDWDSATLICGKDTHRHVEHEPIPEKDFDPAAVEFHKKSNENYLKILYSGTDWTTHRT